MNTITAALCAAAATAPAMGGFATINFDTEDDFLSPLVNGQEINPAASPAGEFGILVDFVGLNGSRLAIFDTDASGPNAGGGDPDLLVNEGNALIVQNTSLLTQSTADIFDTPNDNVGGAFRIDLVTPGEVGSIDLIDINAGGQTTLTLTDQNGLQRVYNVPSNWSNQAPTPMGFDTLSLLTTLPQDGEGPGGDAVVTFEDAGYDQTAVASIRFDIAGSAAFDNIVINSLVPAPGALTLLAGAGFAGLRRRRA
ncbi:MAG: hypothetical protein AAGH64_05385 [Planctomycetota bacterium]